MILVKTKLAGVNKQVHSNRMPGNQRIKYCLMFYKSPNPLSQHELHLPGAPLFFQIHFYTEYIICLLLFHKFLSLPLSSTVLWSPWRGSTPVQKCSILDQLWHRPTFHPSSLNSVKFQHRNILTAEANNIDKIKILIFVVFWVRVSLCSSVWPWTVKDLSLKSYQGSSVTMALKRSYVKKKKTIC